VFRRALAPVSALPFRVRPLWLLLAAAAVVLPVVLLLPFDRRTAWDESSTARERPRDEPPTLSLWANRLGPLLRESDALGPPPAGRERLLPWLAQQCSITLRIQELQRHSGRRVESAAEMGRPPYCDDLPLVERATRPAAAAQPPTPSRPR
jgi:hypothetical protein